MDSAFKVFYTRMGVNVSRGCSCVTFRKTIELNDHSASQEWKGGEIGVRYGGRGGSVQGRGATGTHRIFPPGMRAD